MSPNDIEPIAVTIPNACRLAGVGTSKMYELIGAGEVETTTIGKRRLVLYQSLKRRIEAGRSVPKDTPDNWKPPKPNGHRGAGVA